MKRVNFFSLTLAITFLVFGHVPAEGDVVQSKPQTTCPVMSAIHKPDCLLINKEIYADYEDKRVYFCSKSCIEEFNYNPEKYIKILKDQGVTLEEVSKT